MKKMEQDQGFVEQVVKALVDHPDDVKTERKIDEMGVLITLFIHSEDMGQIIGRSGNTVRAIRTLLRVVGARNNARVNLKIDEPEGARRPRQEKPVEAEAEAAADTSAVDDLQL